MYDQVHKQTKLEKNLFYLTLIKESRSIRISRNSPQVIGARILRGCKLLVSKISIVNPQMTIKLEIAKKIEDFKVASEYTVRDIVEIIDIKYLIPSSTMRAVYEVEVLSNDTMTLKELGVKAGEKICVLRGSETIENSDTNVNYETFSMRFADISYPTALQKLQWAKSAPEWLIARPGLCLEGKCTNSKCKANGNMVIVNKGIGKPYDLREDKYMNNCPICSKYVDVELCAFNNCLYHYSGRKYVEKGKPSVLVKPQEKLKARDEYCRYSVDKVSTLEWDTLVINRFSASCRWKQ